MARGGFLSGLRWVVFLFVLGTLWFFVDEALESFEEVPAFASPWGRIVPGDSTPPRLTHED